MENLMYNMAAPTLIVFDVNETLLDLETMEPTFQRIFGDKSAMRGSPTSSYIPRRCRIHVASKLVTRQGRAYGKVFHDAAPS
jgi:hypothetical protein